MKYIIFLLALAGAGCCTTEEQKPETPLEIDARMQQLAEERALMLSRGGNIQQQTQP